MTEEQKPTFGKYVVKEMLGEGGMGRVWRAFDPDLEVVVAIKELKEQYRDQQNLERFYREAQIAAKCRHPNIVLITDLSKIPPYFVMEFLEAAELSSYVHKGKPISLARTVKILTQVCEGLGFLHGRGIFHRDLKPANIMILKDDAVKITDFGISKAPFGQATMTQVIMGTIPYMSPEQITTPSKVDGRSDLWALGVVLYELTQRRHPFPGEGDINTIFHIVHSPPADLGVLPAPIADKLRAVLMKALQKNPDDRIRTTAEFKGMLLDLIGGVPDPESIVFPSQEQPVGTGTLDRPGAGFTILQDLGDRARMLAEQIEQLPAEKQALLEESGVHKRAMEIARMARILIEDKNPIALEAAIRDLESQKAALEGGLSRAVARLISEAESLLLDGEYAEASERYLKVLAAEPGQVEARRGLDRARQALDREAEVEAAVQAGKDLAGQGDLEGAAEELQRVLQMRPGHGEAGRLLSDVRARLAQAEQIRNLLRQAENFVAARKYDEARACLAQVLEREPANEAAKALLAGADQGSTLMLKVDGIRQEARSLFEREDWGRAEAAFKALLGMEPGDREAREALAAIQEIRKEEEEIAKVRPFQEKVEGALDGLAAEIAAARDVLDDALLGTVKDLVIRARKSAVSRERKVLDEALAEVERVRKQVREAVRRAAEAEKDRADAAEIQGRVVAEIDALGAEVEAAQKSLDDDLLTSVKDVVLRGRRAAQAPDRPALEEALAEVRSVRSAVGEAVRRAAEILKERQAVGALQERISWGLDALGAEMDGVREVLDRALLSRIKETVLRARQASGGLDRKTIEGALAEIESARQAVREAGARAAEEAYKGVAPLLAKVREVPKEDHAAIGAALMGKALEAAASVEGARQQGIAAMIRKEGESLASLVEEIGRQREAALAKGAAAIKEAISALEAVLKPSEKSLKEGTARTARDLIARAGRDAAGPRLHPIAADVEALRASRESILREIQETLRALRGAVQKSRAALEAAATKNRRAVARKPDLSRKIDGLLKTAAGAAGNEAPESLERLVREIDEAISQVPFDPLRFMPHAIAAAGVLIAAGAFVTWRYVQAHTAHPYDLRVVPWGRVVSIQDEAGSSLPAPSGESPFHSLSLVPGTYSITVENPATGGRETVTAKIPAEGQGTVRLPGVDTKDGVRRLLDRDPYFAQSP